tara:strand:- start:1459 stop:3168 length:1710 start_codon:yes stop_codon:yes gene_type:complete
MNIDTLVESFYSKKDETESIIKEVLSLLVGGEQAEALIREQREAITLTFDGVPDIPISEIPWSSVQTVEGGADIPSPQRKQLEQFLDDIAGDDLKDKVEGLAKFYQTDPVQLLEQGFFGDTDKERISKALGYLTFYKTLTKIVAHFNASSAGFSFEAFLGVLLGGAQIATGEGTIADLTANVGGEKVPISLKLYTAGSLKVGGSFTDLVNDLRKYEKMQYVAVTKKLDDQGSGRLDFYRFDFTLDNVANLMYNGGLENPGLMRLPQGFINDPDSVADVKIPPPPKAEDVLKLYHDRVKELGDASDISQDILVNAVKLVGLPEDTSQLKTPKRFGRDPLMPRAVDNPTGAREAALAYRMGLLSEPAPKAPTTKAARAEWIETYGDRIVTALRIYNEIVVAAYNEVTELTNANLAARQELMGRAGGAYAKDKKQEGAKDSIVAYNNLTPEQKKKALLLSHGYVNTDQFELTEPRILDIKTLAAGKEIFPANQDKVMLGSIEIGQEQVVNLMQKISEIIDTSVFAIFSDLKVLTTNIQSYFGNGLQNDQEAQTAIDASKSIGERTKDLQSDK